jgi:polyisoprenoid-binding protein YceI
MRSFATLVLCALLLSPATATSYVVGEASEANYRIREQLAGLRFPNDAVGVTRAIEGSIRLGDDGALLDGSRVLVGLANLVSDQPRRDGFVRQNTLHTARFPQAVFVPQRITGLPSPLPTSGEVEIVIEGMLTIRDHTFPTSWQGVATFDGDLARLEAATRFTFEEAALTKPRVASVLSVDDEIALEVRLVLRRVE